MGVALFLPFGCNKGRSRAAKRGTKRNPKSIGSSEFDA